MNASDSSTEDEGGEEDDDDDDCINLFRPERDKMEDSFATRLTDRHHDNELPPVAATSTIRPNLGAQNRSGHCLDRYLPNSLNYYHQYHF